MTDTVADMIIRIKNAYLARQDEVRMPSSKLRASIAQLLVSNGYLVESTVEEQQPQNNLILKLRYVGAQPAMTEVRRISKPGRRVYVTADKLPRVLAGHGTAILSTSSGLMTDKQAKQANVGGEVLFTVW